MQLCYSTDTYSRRETSVHTLLMWQHNVMWHDEHVDLKLLYQHAVLSKACHLSLCNSYLYLKPHAVMLAVIKPAGNLNLNPLIDSHAIANSA